MATRPAGASALTPNLYSLFFERFGDAPDRDFLRLPDGDRVTYGEIHEASGRYAGALAQLGVLPGDRVVVCVDKSVGNVALYLGCLRAGAVFVPLNVAYTTDEIDYFVTDASPRVFVGRPNDPPALSRIATDAGVSHVESLGRTGEGSLNVLASQCQPLPHDAERTPDAIVAMLYTSGTTGRPKGAMLSCENLATNALALQRIWGWRADDVLLHALPIFHVHGLFVALHCAMLGASAVEWLDAFDTAAVREALPRSTVMMGVPTFYTRLLADPAFERGACRNMRLFVSGSAPLHADTFATFEARTGQRILERYGMTECGMIASNPLDGERIAGTVGFALPGVDIRVTGADGATLPSGEFGAVQVRGPNVCAGYWLQPRKTAETQREGGWFVTGDIGSLDDQGRLTLTGRASDLIISGGYNVYPKEVEQAIDAIAGVLESAVVGLADNDLGEIVAAVVTREPGSLITEQAIVDHLSSRLARFKQPRRVCFMDALPRNAMGKVQKNLVRAWLTA